jgi:hypothetical protein
MRLAALFAAAAVSGVSAQNGDWGTIGFWEQVRGLASGCFPKAQGSRLLNFLRCTNLNVSIATGFAGPGLPTSNAI